MTSRAANKSAGVSICLVHLLTSSADAKVEHHPDWENIVQMSYATGGLGKKKVRDLELYLFPRDLYPQKYDNNGNWRG